MKQQLKVFQKCILNLSIWLFSHRPFFVFTLFNRHIRQFSRDPEVKQVWPKKMKPLMQDENWSDKLVYLCKTQCKTIFVLLSNVLKQFDSIITLFSKLISLYLIFSDFSKSLSAKSNYKAISAVIAITWKKQQWFNKSVNLRKLLNSFSDLLYTLWHWP